MDLLTALKNCDVFDIQINWKSEQAGCDRYSEFLCDANISLPEEGEDVGHQIEISWGDTEHDVHSVYLSHEAIQNAQVENGICVVEGYTEEDMPDLVKPMRFRLFKTLPYFG